jgi:general secretion pathway protein K
MTGRRHTRTRQRGVALIIALVVVALATILATRIGASGARDQRRAATLLAQQQAFQIALGSEALAAEVFKLDTDRSGPQGRDSLDEPWATPIGPLPFEGGSVTPRVEDMQGRFNLNNLVKADREQRNDVAYEQFRRLLEALQLEPKWADLMVDWIDENTIATGADGAEDGVYTGQQPPYRAANRWITSTSELLALPGFGAERYRLLQPYVAALPNDTRLNVCTAPGLVLDTLAPGMKAFGQDPKLLAQNREKGCFPYVPDVEAAIAQTGIDPQLQAAIRTTLGERSTYFRVTSQVSIGTAQFTLYSLLERNGGGARAILRSFGTE